MKIAFSVKTYVHKGGGQTYLRYLAEGLLNAGHQVDVFALSGPGDMPCSAFHKVRVGVCPRFLREYRLASRSAHLLRDADYDAIFGEQKLFYLDVVKPGGGVWHQYYDREIRSLEGNALAVLTRRLSLKERMSHRLEKMLYACPRLRHVIVNSHATARALLDEYEIGPERVHVIYDGVDMARFHPDQRRARRPEARKRLGLGESDYVLLLLANNFRLKGLRPLMRSMVPLMAGIGDRPVKLLAVGRKPRAYHLRLRARLGLTGNVQFHGWSAPDDFYAAADVLAHPTFHDPCATVCLEAMGCGLPVVTTQANGARELIQEGANGFVIDDALNVEALADRLLTLADDDLRHAMAPRARAAVQHLTPEHNVEQVLPILEAVARRS